MLVTLTVSKSSTLLFTGTVVRKQIICTAITLNILWYISRNRDDELSQHYLHQRVT